MSAIRPESLTDDKEVRRLAGERRERIRDAVFELLAGDSITTAELKHFELIASLFHLSDRIEAITDASNPEARLEKLVAVMLVAAELALDDKPKQSGRQFEKEMMARYETVAAINAGKGKPDPDAGPVAKVHGRTTKYYHAIRSRMSPAELAEDRVKKAEAMRRYRANRKAAKGS